MEATKNSIVNQITQELNERLETSLLPFFEKRDGAARLAQALPNVYSPEKIIGGSNECRAWELAGLFYLNKGRPHEALPIFTTLYDHMLARQENGERIHKGMPLVFIYECYSLMGFVALPKRYLMLTLIEDAISEKGKISPDTSGIYFRLVWLHGLPDSELQRYANQAYKLFLKYPNESFFPEWILQELDNNWMTGFPTSTEAAVYSANPRYIKHLINRFGDKSGSTLERLADYILSCMPGCRTTRRKRSHSTDYDIICSVEGLEVDFRSELG